MLHDIVFTFKAGPLMSAARAQHTQRRIFIFLKVGQSTHLASDTQRIPGIRIRVFEYSCNQVKTAEFSSEFVVLDFYTSSCQVVDK